MLVELQEYVIVKTERSIIVVVRYKMVKHILMVGGYVTKTNFLYVKYVCHWMQSPLKCHQDLLHIKFHRSSAVAQT